MCARFFHRMDAEDALDDITAYQLRMWLAYQELEPVDAEAGLITSMLANVNRASKDAPYFKPTDFTAFVIEPYVPPRTPEQRWNSLKGELNMLAAASRARREKREREQREKEQQEREQQTQQQQTTDSDSTVTPTPMPTLPETALA